MEKKKKIVLTLFVVILSIAFGVVSGFFLDKSNLLTYGTWNQFGQNQTIKFHKGDQFGPSSSAGVNDSAIGILKASDDLNKGSHKLIRGSDSLTVYLISSTLDLNQFLNKGLQVWGETIQNKNVGWFMDVIRLKILVM